MLQNTINGSLPYAGFEHRLAVRSCKHFCRFLKPFTHACTLIPESARTQVGQKIAHVKRCISQAKPIKVYDKDLVAMKEQLARLKPSMCGPIYIRLQCLQAFSKLLSEPPYIF